jgi:hypothetical protein
MSSRLRSNVSLAVSSDEGSGGASNGRDMTPTLGR